MVKIESYDLHLDEYWDSSGSVDSSENVADGTNDHWGARGTGHNEKLCVFGPGVANEQRETLS